MRAAQSTHAFSAAVAELSSAVSEMHTLKGAGAGSLFIRPQPGLHSRYMCGLLVVEDVGAAATGSTPQQGNRAAVALHWQLAPPACVTSNWPALRCLLHPWDLQVVNQINATSKEAQVSSDVSTAQLVLCMSLLIPMLRDCHFS